MAQWPKDSPVRLNYWFSYEWARRLTTKAAGIYFSLAPLLSCWNVCLYKCMSTAIKLRQKVISPNRFGQG